MRDAADRWRDLDFELCKRMNGKGRRFVGRHSVEMISVPPRERDMFHQAVQHEWAECESARALGIPTTFIIAYMTDNGQPRTRM